MKKGFTLIELLAVIVILAIIALIATPIILGIIDDTKKEGNELSIEMYGKAVKNAVAAYELKYKKTSTSFNQLTIEYDGNKVECETQKLYEDGSFYLAKCKVNDVLVENYTYGTKLDECTLNDKDSSNGASLSDEITCGGEQFYVMSADTETVTMLTKYNIDLTTHKQSATAGTTPFSQSAYWKDDSGKLLSKYGTSYPAYVYENESNIVDGVEQNLVYTHVSAYETYLKNNLGVNVIDAKLMSYEEAETLGCPEYTCTSAPSWVYSTSYWLGSALDHRDVWIVYSIGYFYSTGFYYGANSVGVRPVVTISASDI